MGAGLLTSEGGWPYQCGGTVPFASSTEYACLAGGSHKDKAGLGEQTAHAVLCGQGGLCVHKKEKQSLEGPHKDLWVKSLQPRSPGNTYHL